MSEASPPKIPRVELSPEARALLAELNINPLHPELIEPTELREDPSAKADMVPDIVPDILQADLPTPVLLSPHKDAHAEAFAKLLDHIEDSEGDADSDERAAIAAATNYRQQKNLAPAPLASGSLASGSLVSAQAAEEEFGTGQRDGVADWAENGSDLDADIAAEFGAVVPQPQGAASASQDAVDGPLADLRVDEPENGDDETFDETFDDNFDDVDFDLDMEETSGGFFARLRGKGGGAVRRLVGFKDVSSAYSSQSGATFLPYTILRTVVLVLVAAVPPLINLAVIQPQISDNNRKLTQIRSFEAKSQEDKKLADDLAEKIGRAQRASKRRIGALVPEPDAQILISQYFDALQKFDVNLLSYNVTTEPSRKVISGREVQEATVVEMQLQSRYDIYVDIRKIFVEQANNIIILEEVFEAQPDSLQLEVTAKYLLPTYRAYDSELDAAGDAKQEDTE